MMIRKHDIDGLTPVPPRVNHCVEVEGPCRTIYVTGQLGCRPDGSFPKDAAEQVELAWRQVLAILARCDMFPDALVKVNAYVTDAAYVPTYRAVRDRMLNGVTTASTCVVVAALVEPQAVVEIEAVAAAPFRPAQGA